MSDEYDGGYYAIKGFLYQFDKTIIEVLSNPTIKVNIEQRQDIDYQDFVIQVKHKEAQKFTLSTIRKPVIGLIEMFKTDQTQKFCLYCHFKEKGVAKWIPNADELDNILGDQKEDYTAYLKERFIGNFFIQFSDDFEKQFYEAISLIRSSFSLPDEDLAFFYHSLLRSKLLDISTEKSREQRAISKQELEGFLNNAEKTVFYRSYAKYLDKEKYERLVKKQFFTSRSPNLENFERLFVIECDEDTNIVELSKITTCLRNRYFKINKSPQPYICFMNLESTKLTLLKQDLLDQGILFDDGTYFNGDRFRLEGVIEKNFADKKREVKIINHEYLDRVIAKVKFHQVFQFYIDLPVFLETENEHVKIQILETKQATRILS